MKPCLVPRLEAEDRAALLQLWVDAWAATLPGIDFTARRDWVSERLDALLGAGALLLATREEGSGQPVAFLTLDPRTGEIDQLAVDLSRQGRGLARALLAEAKRLSPAGLTLSVNVANTRAVTLYERSGFVRTGETTNPRSGLPVWTMRWAGPVGG